MARKSNVLDLDRFLNQAIHVKMSGGREVEGVLKGHDEVEFNYVLIFSKHCIMLREKDKTFPDNSE